MAKVYADLIRKGLKTIDDVPPKLKKAVEKLLKDALDAEENLVEEPEEATEQ